MGAVNEESMHRLFMMHKNLANRIHELELTMKRIEELMQAVANPMFIVKPGAEIPNIEGAPAGSVARVAEDVDWAGLYQSGSKDC